VYYTLHMSMRTLERERQPEMWVITTDLPTSAIQQFTFTIDLHFNASFTIITELAGELPAVLPDGPEGFTGLRLTRRDLAVGRVEGWSLIIGRAQGYCLSAVKCPALPASRRITNMCFII